MSIAPGNPPEAAPAATPGISVVIVSYNVREFLDACLQSVFHAAARSRVPVEVIVFDNDSSDATIALSRPRWPQVTWIASDRNLGFGSGCNRGAEVAAHDLLLFLNPDTLVREDTLQVMADFFAGGSDVGVAGCKIVNRDGTLQAACKRSFPSPRVAAYKFIGLGNLFPKSRVFGQYNLTYLDENQTHEVDAVSGSFLCIRADLYRVLGGFDEEFFMYGEDLDLCFRAKLLGRRNYYHPATQVIHFKGESAKSRPLRSFLYFYEAMVIFSRKHLELRALPWALLNLGIGSLALFNFLSSRFRKWPRWAADLALVNAVLATVTSLYERARGFSSLLERHTAFYLLWHLFVSVSVLIPLAYVGDYGRRPARLRATSLALGVGFLAFFSLSFFMHQFAYSRIVFAATAAVSSALLLGWRWVGSHGGKLFRKILGGSKRTAILGTGASAQALADLIPSESLEGYEFVGFLKLGAGAVPPAVRSNVIGDARTLEILARKLDLQAVVIALDEGAYAAALEVLATHGPRALEVKMLVGTPEGSKTTLIDLNFAK